MDARDCVVPVLSFTKTSLAFQTPYAVPAAPTFADRRMPPSVKGVFAAITWADFSSLPCGHAITDTNLFCPGMAASPAASDEAILTFREALSEPPSIWMESLSACMEKSHNPAETFESPTSMWTS